MQKKKLKERYYFVLCVAFAFFFFFFLKLVITHFLCNIPFFVFIICLVSTPFGNLFDKLLE